MDMQPADMHPAGGAQPRGNELRAGAVTALRWALRGNVVLRGDSAYPAARRVWNGAVDKHPALIVYCENAHDVAATLAFARDGGHALAVRSGGHNVAGLSVCEGGVVIDLSRMTRIAVDPARRIAQAGAGLRLGEFDAATQAHGLATTMGVNSDTGIAGLTLGGGFGKLGRKYGLACDNLLAADVVLADGRQVRASEQEHADLFWGLRGGGGNFGIVTAFTYRLHPVGPMLLTGSVLHPFAQARDAMRFYAGYAATAPDELSVDAALVTAPSGERFFSISACHCGSAAQGERLIQPLLAFGSPAEARLQAVPYLQIQAAGDSLFPPGRRYYWKAQFLRTLSDEAIDALLEAYAASPLPGALLVLQQVGGAIARTPRDATPYVNRDAQYDCFPLAIWDDPAQDEAAIQWARAAWQAIRPFSTGGVYANNLGDEGEDRVHAAYGDNYARLAALKREVDPGNVFRLNQNILPAAAGL